MIWTRDKIIVDLKSLYKNLGHSPSSREVKQALYQAGRRLFGSFNNAKKSAGLKITPIKHHRVRGDANKLTTEAAYILGVLNGDGYYRKRKSPARTSGEIGLKVRDLDFAQNFRRALKKWSGIQPKFWEKDGEFFVALYSVDAVNAIRSLNLDKINKVARKIKSLFLRGLFDSEGGVIGKNLDKRRYACRWIHFSNSKREIINAVSKLLEDFGIRHRIRSRVHSGFGSKKTQYEILIFRLENLEKFYKCIGFSIKRKINKLLEVIHSYEKYRAKTASRKSV